MKPFILISLIQFLFIFSCSTTKTAESPLVSPEEEPIQIVSVPKWSADQGIHNFLYAKNKCKSIGMRVPTIEELKLAYKSKITKSWDKYFSYYWSSTPAGQERYYYLYTYDGRGYPSTPINAKRSDVYGIRCIK